MAEYLDFKHGTRGTVDMTGVSFAGNGRSRQAIVYIGTAPVNQVEGGAKNVNRPILVRDISDARKYLGYSDDWASYTLCEAMHVHFEVKNIGPLVFINVLNPDVHKKSGGTATLKPENGRVQIVNAEDAILDTLKIVSDGTTLEKGTHYTASYDFARKAISIVEKTRGSLGSAELTITWSKIDPTAVKPEDVIGASDGYGLNTGIYAVKNVYNVTGYIPAYLLAPGFSNIPAVHDAMVRNSQQISGHWNAYMFVDMPIITTEGDPISLQTAAEWRNENGYNRDNESVFFPLAKGTDGRTYHLSVLNAANFQELLIQNDGVPYMSGSNTECSLIEDLYLSETVLGRVYDDEVINRTLNANGINSAAYIGGRWAIWGMFSGSYSQVDETPINVNDTCTMMMYYLTNDFQHRRNIDIDKCMPVNTLKSIVAEEQARLDSLLGIGALTYGKVILDASKEARADVYKGDFRIRFSITNTPLAKSMTADVGWASDGFEVYFMAMDAA